MVEARPPSSAHLLKRSTARLRRFSHLDGGGSNGHASNLKNYTIGKSTLFRCKTHGSPFLDHGRPAGRLDSQKDWARRQEGENLERSEDDALQRGEGHEGGSDVRHCAVWAEKLRMQRSTRGSAGLRTRGVQCGVRRGGGPGADEAPEGVQDIERDPRNRGETGRSSWKQNVGWKIPTTTRVTRAVT